MPAVHSISDILLRILSETRLSTEESFPESREFYYSHPENGPTHQRESFKESHYFTFPSNSLALSNPPNHLRHDPMQFPNRPYDPAPSLCPQFCDQHPSSLPPPSMQDNSSTPNHPFLDVTDEHTFLSHPKPYFAFNQTTREANPEEYADIRFHYNLNVNESSFEASSSSPSQSLLHSPNAHPHPSQREVSDLHHSPAFSDDKLWGPVQHLRKGAGNPLAVCPALEDMTQIEHFFLESRGAPFVPCPNHPALRFQPKERGSRLLQVWRHPACDACVDFSSHDVPFPVFVIKLRNRPVQRCPVDWNSFKPRKRGSR